MSDFLQKKFGLKKITLTDYELYKSYMEKASYFTGQWASNFTYIWSLSRRRNIEVFYKIIDGLLVTFIKSKRNFLYIWCLPFGKGSADHVLQVLVKSLQLCKECNNYFSRSKEPYVYLLNDIQLYFLRTCSLFDRSLQAICKDSKEFVWDIPQIIERKGKEFKDVRYWVNRITKAHPSLTFREYTPSDLNEVILIKKHWNEASIKKYKRISDDHIFTQVFKYYQELNEMIFVATIENRVVGFVTGAILPDGLAWGCLAKGMPEYKGLYEFLYTEFARSIQNINPAITYLLTGSDNNHQGLRTFKEKFNPILRLNLYSIKLR